MNSNCAHQYTERKTGPLEDCTQGQQQPQYRFEFEEFEGRKGFLLLDKILDTIIPQAGYKVWRKIYDLVPNDPKPYVGSETLAAQADVTYRQINRALQALKEMGLMEERPDIAHTKDGKGFAVIRKDFTNLYKFAHEYYLWMNSQGFAMYPPDRRFADMIKENRHLYAKLVRFENYRIILKTERRGPKQVMQEMVRWNSKDTVKLDDNVQLGEERTNDLEVYFGTSKYQSESLYYESNSNYLDSTLDSNQTQEFSITQDSPFTRRDESDVPHDERGTHEGFTMGSGKGSEEYSFSIPKAPQQGNISRREAEPSSQRNVPRDAKGITAQPKGGTLISETLEECERKKTTPAKERYNKWAEAEELRRDNRSLANVMSHIVDEFNQPEKSKRSMTTFVLNLQKSSQMSFEEITELVYYVRANVMSKPDSTFKARYMGKANRAPLFMSDMKRGAEKGMQYLIDDQARHAQIKAIGQIQEPEVEIDQEVIDQVVDEIIRPATEASYQREQEIRAQVEQEPVKQETVYVAQEELDHAAEYMHTQASKETKEIMMHVVPDPSKLMVSKQFQCSCGCQIVYRRGMRDMDCVVCKPQKHWSEETICKVAALVSDINSVERYKEIIREEWQYQGYEIA